MIYVGDLTLVDLWQFEFLAAEKSAKPLPFCLKGFLDNRITRIFFFARNLPPIVDKAIALELNESPASFIKEPTSHVWLRNKLDSNSHPLRGTLKPLCCGWKGGLYLEFAELRPNFFPVRSKMRNAKILNGRILNRENGLVYGRIRKIGEHFAPVTYRRRYRRPTISSQFCLETPNAKWQIVRRWEQTRYHENMLRFAPNLGRKKAKKTRAKNEARQCSR